MNSEPATELDSGTKPGMTMKTYLSFFNEKISRNTLRSLFKNLHARNDENKKSEGITALAMKTCQSFRPEGEILPDSTDTILNEKISRNALRSLFKNLHARNDENEKSDNISASL